MDVNLKGVFLMTQAFMPEMVRQRYGQNHQCILHLGINRRVLRSSVFNGEGRPECLHEGFGEGASPHRASR